MSSDISKELSKLIRVSCCSAVAVCKSSEFRSCDHAAPPSPADSGKDAPIPLPNVSGKILAKVIEYCKYHVAAEEKADGAEGSAPAKSEEDVKSWDTDFVKVDQGTLFELILVRCCHDQLRFTHFQVLCPGHN